MLGGSGGDLQVAGPLAEAAEPSAAVGENEVGETVAVEVGRRGRQPGAGQTADRHGGLRPS